MIPAQWRTSPRITSVTMRRMMMTSSIPAGGLGLVVEHGTGVAEDL
jgi:hypothetical protein